MTNTIETLGDALPRELARVRRILPYYLEVPHGHIAAHFIKQDIAFAETAIANNDIVQMLQAYQRLKDVSE
jgi:hypothetical protein